VRQYGEQIPPAAPAKADAGLAEAAAATLISVGCAWHFCIGLLQQKGFGYQLPDFHP